MKLKSVVLDLAPANFLYSSNTEDKHQLCNFLKHPTTQPVRCCIYKTTNIDQITRKNICSSNLSDFIQHGISHINQSNKANKSTSKIIYIHIPFLDYSGLELGDFSRLKPQKMKQVKIYDNHDSRDNK